MNVIGFRIVLEHIETEEIKIIITTLDELIYRESEIYDLDLFDGGKGIWSVISKDMFIGLFDMHTESIFENDISEHHGVVEWNNEESKFGFRCFEYGHWHEMDYSTIPIEITGNIHENKDKAERFRNQQRGN